ncbi:ferrous iron transport protein A [Synechococcus sp. CS-1325]|nr:MULTISPECIES: FeoA family protein [unclassified Synechococcus]MCT0200294.1 ferrous iron transport protein A [Synechococcus sp. CS-1325]MCT0230132.1 ferrous iron transport protein A [Synechococcus sp. CS-1324]PZV01580.1 MAG: ferrous iron transport protein A [Cyanobium sp.]MCT0214305.1 ferrous iron transport protein A [Synechococcus sp. CS-1326]MCT0234469.1 ferrous iron transport protein A [Synechococcus sp. CS-1327]
MSLAEAPIGAMVLLGSLPADPSLRERLRAMGVKPGITLQVVRRGFPGGILHVRVGLLEFMLRRRDGIQMEVAPISD